MEKAYLEEEEYLLFKKFLNLEDYQLVADHTKFSTSTVHNIVNRRTKVNEDTKVIVETLYLRTNIRMEEYKSIIEDNQPAIKDMAIVKEYNKLKEDSKWF